MLVGRTREIELTEAALTEGATVALVGPSGIGKSTIAREVALRRDGSVFIDCYGVSFEGLGAHVAEARGLDDAAVPLSEQLADLPLLVLDDWNAELPIAAVREVFAGPLLVTAHTVPDGASPLPVHPFEVPDTGKLAGTTSFELFRQEAERVRLGAMEDCPADAVADIVRQVNGNPLGIVLAAHHSAAIGAEEVARLMRDGVELRDESRSPRQQSMAVALRFSWDRLGESNQRVFYVASRFRRPVRVTMLAELTGMEVSRVLPIVGDLTQRGALTPGKFPRPAASWRETALRQFRIERADEAQELDDRIFERALSAAGEYEARNDIPAIDDGPSLWEAALDGFERRPPESIGLLTTSLLRWSARFAAARFAPGFLGAEAEYSRTWKAVMLHARALRHDAAREAEILERAIALARTDEERSESCFYLAMNALRQPDFDRALALVTRARKFHESFFVLLLGIATHMSRGEWEEGRELLRALHERGEPPSQEHALGLRLYDTWGAPTVERLSVAQATIEMSSQATPPTRSLACRTLADVLERDHGRYEEARRQRDKAAEFADSQGGLRLVASCAAERAWGELMAGEVERATELFAAIDVDQLYPETQTRWHIAHAMLHCWDGDLPLARREADAAQTPTLHVPPLGDAKAVVDAAIAIQSGDDAIPAGHLPELMARVWESRGLSRRQQVELYAEVEALRIGTGWGQRLAELWADRFAPPLFGRLDALSTTDAQVAFLDDFSALRVDGQWHYAAETSAELLRALASGEPRTFEEVAESVWPGEIIVWESLVNRVSVLVSRVRRLGLKSVLVKTGHGFLLDCTIHVEAS